MEPDRTTPDLTMSPLGSLMQGLAAGIRQDQARARRVALLRGYSHDLFDMAATMHTVGGQTSETEQMYDLASTLSLQAAELEQGHAPPSPLVESIARHPSAAVDEPYPWCVDCGHLRSEHDSTGHCTSRLEGNTSTSAVFDVDGICVCTG